jgi:hypothetical protein
MGDPRKKVDYIENDPPKMVDKNNYFRIPGISC